MNRLRRRLIDWNDDRPGPSIAEYAVILIVIGAHRLPGAALTASQTSVILSTVSGSV